MDGSEQCDDGNDLNDDTCSNECQLVVHECGNGRVDVAGEKCDDGNVIDGDGCSASCDLEGACAAYETPTTTAFPCGPTVEIGSGADLLAWLAGQWPDNEIPGAFPVTPNLRASVDLTVPAADLPTAADVFYECSYESWLCESPMFVMDSRFTSGTLYIDAGGLHVTAGTTFRVSHWVFTQTFPPFYPLVEIVRPCEEPCFVDETRCVVDQVCHRNWDYCLRCLGLSAECCACTDPTGAAHDGSSCSYIHSDIVFEGSCSAGYCYAY